MMLFSASAIAQEPPAGWRLPRASELTDEARNGSPSHFTKASGDFNGDGVTDTAFVLKSTRYSGEALWVWLSQSDASHRWQRLESIKWPKEYSSVGLFMAVETQTPGVVPYGCFDSAPQEECDFRPPGGRPKLKLRNESLVYFKPESAASLYFWSNKYQRFLKVWLSD
jgi:hypothetical protein